MISILNLIVFTIYLIFIITVGISTTLENAFAQEDAHQSSSSSSSLLSTLDNSDNMIISEEICPPYCNPPSPIQDLPQEQTR